MSNDTPWGRADWQQPRRRVGRIMPMAEPRPTLARRLRWLPLWAALAMFLFFAILLGLGSL